MKSLNLIVAAFLLATTTSTLAQIPQKISYQGLLTTGPGTPVADGTYDLKFEIFNLPGGGTLRYSETRSGVSVQKGTFNLALGPLPAIFSESLYVQVTALAGPGIVSPLTFAPRSELTSAPYALQSLSLLGPQSVATGAAAIAGGSNNRARGNYSVVSGGGGAILADSNSAVGDYAAIGGGLINSAGAYSATVGGGEGNRASGYIATIGGGATNRATNDMATIGGGWLNTSSGIRSTVAGGEIDTASGDWSAVGGGYRNSASGWYATVGGGFGNSASWHLATIAGGGANTATNNFATVGGGNGNAATGYTATVGGGAVDSASGFYATIPGGAFNTAAGAYSYAAGRRAKANHDGSFVWGDQTNADFASTGVNQFLIRASGGVGIGTNAPAATLTVNDNVAGMTPAAPGIMIGNPNGSTAIWQGKDNTHYFELGWIDPDFARLNAGGGHPLVLQTDGGNVGIGTISPGYLLQVGTSGDGTQARANAWNTFSDQRFKDHVQVIGNSLDKVSRLRGVSFDWKKSGDHSLGFIAQEVESVLPEIVSTDKEGYKSLDYGKVIPVLVEAIKEQKAKSEAQQKEITELREMLRSLVIGKKTEHQSMDQVK